MSDRILNFLLFIVYTAIVISATILCIKLYDKRDRKVDVRYYAIERAMSNISEYTKTLSIMDADYVATRDDSALVDYVTAATLNLEEIIALSPFQQVRDSATKVQNEFFHRFPVVDRNQVKMDIQNGDLVVRHNNDLHSELFRKLSTRERKYSHIGIVHRINADSIFVLHAVGDDITGRGSISDSPLHSFMPEGDFDVAIYRLREPQQVRDAWVRDILRLQAKDVAFDPSFNISDTTRLYCAEMLAYTLNRTLQREAIKHTGRFMGKDIYTIDDCYMIPEMECIYQRSGTSEQ